MNKPEFIDNRDGNTLARGLGEVLGPANVISEAQGDRPDELRIATGFFSPSGFSRIAKHIARIPSVRLMLGVDLGAAREDQRPPLGQTAQAFNRKRIRDGINGMDAGLRSERDRLPFTRTSRVALLSLVEALHAGNMAVRRYERDCLHAKAYIFSGNGGPNNGSDGLIAGSSNLTTAGLTTNLELDIGRYEPRIVRKAVNWFDELWVEAEPYDLAILFEEVFRPRTPWEIFVRVLWQLYGDEVDEDARADQNLPLTSFQMHGVARALRLIRDTGGAIVADEVGLGKTFIAGEILQVYRERRQRALLICPAALRDSTWKKFLARFELFVECLSFEELAMDAQLQDPLGQATEREKLQRSLDEYQLVVVDEAHNYRNPDAPTRAGALRRLLFGQRRDVLLLTATPVNNSLWDLYHLVRFFVRQDAHFADKGILSIRGRFDQAMHEDPTSLSPDILFPIIDATTVKRTRQFIKKHYENDHIPGPDGRPVPIVFPKPVAKSVRYDLEALLPGFFDLVESALDPDSDDAIEFARYMPNAYLLDDVDQEEAARERGIVGLLRSGLLKRFESSGFAFGNTVSKMAREHQTFLDALDEGYVVTTQFMKEMSADDEAVFQDVLGGSEHKDDASLYDSEGLRAAVERDLDQLRGLANDAASIVRDEDPKLHALAEEICEIAAQAKREAVDREDERQKRKLLVFSFFEDTVEWILGFLCDEQLAHPGLSGYRDRIAAVSGSGNLSEVDRQKAVQGFAPVSMEAPAGNDADMYDLLITTDVLAEGVNLQQCRHIINFDMPWNPMRLVQRHGRIDRIGSRHNRVFLRTIFPADRLDRLLRLEERILDKLAMAAASVGVAAPIEGSAHGAQVFTETREEIEKLLQEDASLYERGGTSGSAQTGEEYRQTLRKELDRNREEIINLPWKVGSGMVKGPRRGVFFCASVGDRTYLRFVPADEDWRVATDSGAIVRETGTCLRIIECDQETATWCPEWLQDRAYDFWDVAQGDILDAWLVETDPANLQPKVRPLNIRVAEFIRDNPPIDVPQDRVTRALDVLESPWPRREEIILRKWFDEETQQGGGKSRELVERVLATGLDAVVPPEPLPPISRDDVQLVCWMGVERATPQRAAG